MNSLKSLSSFWVFTTPEVQENQLGHLAEEWILLLSFHCPVPAHGLSCLWQRSARAVFLAGSLPDPWKITISVSRVCRASSQRQQQPIGLHLPVSHWGTAAAVSLQLLLSVSPQLKCSRVEFSSSKCLFFFFFASSHVPGRACVCPKCALLNSSVQCLFVLCLVNQNKPIYAVSSREQDLLPVLVICTNCSPEILISTGNSPVEPEHKETHSCIYYSCHISIQSNQIYVLHSWKTSHLNTK